MTTSNFSRLAAANFLHLPAGVQPKVLGQKTLGEIGSWIEGAPVGILVADDQLSIAFLNALARPLFTSVPNVVGKSWADVLRQHWTEDAANEVITVITNALASGAPYSSIDFSADRIDLKQEQRFHWEVHRVLTADARTIIVCYFVGPVS